jgi:hypothetical protein
MMTKNLTLAASITMLVAISGHAGAAGSYTRDRPAATGPSDQHLRRAFNTSYPAMATQTVEPNGHRYHGGPKSND